MTRIFNLILLSCLFLQPANSAQDDFKAGQASIADAIDKISVSKAKLFLYSLNPHDSRIFEGKLPKSPDQVFHGFPILGLAQIVSTQEKTNLLGAFASGVRASDGFIASCFNPRHGIRVITESTTNDFVICFECLQVESYGFGSIRGFRTGGSANTVFNKFLDEYKIKKAE